MTAQSFVVAVRSSDLCNHTQAHINSQVISILSAGLVHDIRINKLNGMLKCRGKFSCVIGQLKYMVTGLLLVDVI